MDGFLLPSGMCTEVGIPIPGWLLTSSPVNVCSREGAVVLVAGEWRCVGEDVDLRSPGKQENSMT